MRWFRKSSFSASSPIGRRAFLAVAVVVGMWASVVAAQDNDPFGAPPAAGADPFGAPAARPGADPFGGAAAAAGGAGTRTAPAARVNESDPVVAAILETQPTTPSELIRAMEMMMNLGREDHAKAFLQRLVDAGLDDQAKAALEEEYGLPLFLRLLRDKTYAPQGEQFAREVIAASDKVVRDPSRLTRLLNQAAGADPIERQKAFAEFRVAGPPAAAFLVKALADVNRRRDHPAIVDALVAMGAEARGPLLGAIFAPEENTRAYAIEALGRMRVERATRYMIAPFLAEESSQRMRDSAELALRRTVGAVPSLASGRVYLRQLIDRMMSGELPGRPVEGNAVELWRWNQERQEPVAMRLPTEAARLMEAGNLAYDLLRISPEDSDYQRLALSTRLKADKILFGPDQPLPQGAGTAYAAAVAAGPDAVEEVLAAALKQNEPLAAAAAAEVLGDIGGPELLRSQGGAMSTLVRALQQPSQRLKFAAMEAILKINPRQSFVGAGFLTQALGRFAASDGVPRALVAHTHSDEARTLGAMLEYLGYETDAATTGREVFLAAARNADYDLVLIDDGLTQPNASETVQMFRKDARTARLPIGVVADFEQPEYAQRIAEADPLAVSFTAPLDTVGMRLRVQSLMEVAGYGVVPEHERLSQAETALDYIGRLAEAESAYPFYDLISLSPAVERSLRTPALAERAARALGLLGTPSGQQALVEIASQHAYPIEQRRTAAAAFATAVKRRGLRLSADSVLAQYDRYNASESLDTETQQVLGSVLDTIEAADQRPLASVTSAAALPVGPAETIAAPANPMPANSAPARPQ
ncbi:MAG: response regulator [Pirellulaceae bacterium]